MQYKNTSIDVVVPLYNESDNLVSFLSTVSEILSSNNFANFRFILIDDGSRDNTWNLITDLKKSFNLLCIRFTRNFGKEAAIFAGLSLSDADVSIIIDADFQHPPEIIPQMIQIWITKEFKIVEGILKKSKSNRSVLYKFFSFCFYRIFYILTKIDLSTSTDYKLLDRKVVEQVVSLKENQTFFRGLTSWLGYPTYKIEFEHVDRKKGKSKWSILKLFLFAINNIIIFTSLPLQFVTISAFVFLFFAMVLFIQTFFRWILHQSVEGFTTVIMLILLTSSIIMLSLGLIGLYLSKIYNEIKKRPKYVISEIK